MIREQLQQLKTGPRDLRRFGLMVGSVLALLGAVLLWRHQAAGPWLLVGGLTLVGVGAAAPRILKPIYIGWMALAFVLGAVVSTVLLTVIFYLAVTPIGLLARCFGKDFLNRKWEPRAATYWVPRPPKARAKRSWYSGIDLTRSMTWPTEGLPISLWASSGPHICCSSVVSRPS